MFSFLQQFTKRGDFLRHSLCWSKIRLYIIMGEDIHPLLNTKILDNLKLLLIKRLFWGDIFSRGKFFDARCNCDVIVIADDRAIFVILRNCSVLSGTNVMHCERKFTVSNN